MPSPTVFFVVWLVLYGLIGLTLGVVWSKTPLWHPWIGCFFVSLAFNAAWTMFFFGLHSTFIALIDLGCLALMLIALMIGAWEIDRRGTYLLAPYLGWVLFATYLNMMIWYSN